MNDDTSSTAESMKSIADLGRAMTMTVGAAEIVPIANVTMQAATPSLAVRSINVVIDSQNKSPHGLPTEIVEVELWPANMGNADWMQFCDVLRFRCERGKSSALIELLGLKPAK